MSDDTERMIREALALCVPDEEQRRDIVTRVRIRDLVQDPEIMAARQLLASASPQELDAAFTALEQRDAPATTPADVASRLSAPDRLRQASETLKATVTAAGGRVREIFVATLTPAPAFRGDRGTGRTDPASTEGYEDRSFAFLIPTHLAQLSGLEAEGSAEIRDGTLHIVISRTLDGGSAPVSVIAIANNEADDPVEMVPDPQYPELLSASITWRHPLTATIDVLITVGTEP